MYEDKTLVCKDCGNEFIFTAGEQEFYAEKGFENEPQRCKDCRIARKNSNKEKRELYTIKRHLGLPFFIMTICFFAFGIFGTVFNPQEEAAKELGIDKAFCKEVDKALGRLQPYKIGKNGNLQEWYHDWSDQDPLHRHQSHLFESKCLERVFFLQNQHSHTSINWNIWRMG